MAMKDITNRDEVVRLVDAFYAKVRVDALLAPKFAHLDWHNHVPIMYNYWSDLLLGGTSYEGSPFQRHMLLDLNAEHFQRWHEIFEETVD
jgi:hemoglobin